MSKDYQSLPPSHLLDSEQKESVPASPAYIDFPDTKTKIQQLKLPESSEPEPTFSPVKAEPEDVKLDSTPMPTVRSDDDLCFFREEAQACHDPYFRMIRTMLSEGAKDTILKGMLRERLISVWDAEKVEKRKEYTPAIREQISKFMAQLREFPDDNYELELNKIVKELET